MNCARQCSRHICDRSIGAPNDLVIPEAVQLANPAGRHLTLDNYPNGHNRAFRKGHELEFQLDALNAAFALG